MQSQLTGTTEGDVTLAKNTEPTTKTTKTRGLKKVVRKLEKAQLSHQRAERKTSKLRVRLERAEARLATVAQHLAAMQTQLEHARSAPDTQAQGASTAVPEASSDARVAPDSDSKALAKTAAAAKSKPTKSKSGATASAPVTTASQDGNSAASAT